MKKLIRFLPLMFLLVSCDLLDNATISSNDVGGDTNLDNNKVGYTVSPTVKIGSTNYASNSSITVLSNDNGVITMKVKSNLPSNKYTSMIPAGLKDATGKLDATVKYKNTAEGILDYTNKDGKPFVIVNYDSKVGDKYVLTKSDGKTITRTVVSKSTTDDYPIMGGFMNIKVMKVEQDSRIPGVTKIVYVTNHKYGLVAVEVFLDDGTSTKATLQ